MSSFALKVICKEALTVADTILVAEGTVAWVVESEWGWTSSPWPCCGLPHLVTFKSREEAEEAAEKWEGHPWYYRPIRVEAVEVNPVYTQVLKGWRECPTS